MNISEKRRNCSYGSRRLPESPQLRVVDIAARLSPENGLREQGFAPERHESPRVKIFGMERPESHASVFRD